MFKRTRDTQADDIVMRECWSEWRRRITGKSLASSQQAGPAVVSSDEVEPQASTQNCFQTQAPDPPSKNSSEKVACSGRSSPQNDQDGPEGNQAQLGFVRGKTLLSDDGLLGKLIFAHYSSHQCPPLAGLSQGGNTCSCMLYTTYSQASGLDGSVSLSAWSSLISSIGLAFGTLVPILGTWDQCKKFRM